MFPVPRFFFSTASRLRAQK